MLIQIPDRVNRWTYRYTKNDCCLEKHADTLKELLNIAVDDIEQNRAIPLHIRADKLEIMELRDILDVWQEKYLVTGKARRPGF